MPTVVATITPQPEALDEVQEAFAKILPDIHAEDGCELYTLFRGEDRLVTVERWSSDEALAAHMQTPHIQGLIGAVGHLLAKPLDIAPLVPVPGGDSPKGVL